MEIIQLNQNNYKQYLPLDIAAFKLAFAGACGDGGGVEIITTDGKLYYFNLFSGDLDKSEVFEIIPFLPDCNFNVIGSSNDMPIDWKNIYLGLGNNLVIRADLYKSLNNAWDDYKQREGASEYMLYCVWKDLILPILNCSQK